MNDYLYAKNLLLGKNCKDCIYYLDTDRISRCQKHRLYNNIEICKDIRYFIVREK